MKIFHSSVILLLSLLLFSGCNGKRAEKKAQTSENDTITVPDTGYTGIKQYMSQGYLIKEVTFKNGVRNGLMKTFYENGKLRQTFWYENDLREDSSRWYYIEGQLFRTTPYKHDTVDGIQKQYFRNGRVKAKIGYEKGLRNNYFEEFTPEGKLITGYSDLIINQTDEYKTRGVYRISLQLSDKSVKVRYFRGDMDNGVFDTAHCKKIEIIKGIGNLDLKKRSSPKTGYVGIVAEVLTSYGNNRLIYRKIELPYNDLD